jgi:hypothetical protein
VPAGPFTLHVPELASVNGLAALLTVLAFVLLFALHRGVITTLAICGGLAVVWHLARL